MRGLLVAKQKKPEQPPSEPDDDERATAPVKLRPSFHELLVLVADDLGKKYGQLIEEHMGKFVRSEAKRIIEARQQKDAARLRSLRAEDN